MPVLTPGVIKAESRPFTLAATLEPDIEHLRRRHGNASTSQLCFALIGQLNLPSSSSSSSSLLPLSQLNCSLLNFDDDVSKEEQVTSWLVGADPVYYLLPVVLIAGIVCDTLSASLLARLLLLRTRCHGDVVVVTSSNVYLLWLAVTCDLWLACTAVRALPDYVIGHVSTDHIQWLDGYAAAVSEWLSCTCLWLLLTMSLNVAMNLSGSDVTWKPRSEEEHQRQNIVENNSSSNHVQHHHHHYQEQQQQRVSQYGACCRQMFVCVAIHIICLVSSLPQFFAYQLVDSPDAELNRTVIVSQLDKHLISSYEYLVVYYWYTVCLSVLLPVPLLIVIAIVFMASLVRRLRTHHKKIPVKPTVVSVPHGARVNSSPVCNCKALDSLRLHIALIILYLLFTCPRSTLLCLRGVFATSARRTLSSLSSIDGDDIIYAMLESFSELTYSIYQASLLPLLASYHGNFRRFLINSMSVCCCNRCSCCSRRRSAPINDNIPVVMATTTFRLL